MQRFFTAKIIIPGVIIGLIGLAILWYLVSPLFINVQVNESLPAAATVKAQEPPAMKTAMADQAAQVVNEPMPIATAASTPRRSPTASGSPSPNGAPLLIKQAEFYNVVHEGKGKAQVFRLPDGSLILRLDEFQVLNGPELHVYLVPTASIPPNIGKDLPGSVDLGRLKGNQGSQNYGIPSNLDIGPFRSVVVWCQPFKVPFIAATFQ